MVEPRDRTEAAEEPLVIYLHPNEGRPANPNTPEGEIRNVAAFAAAVHGASPRRRAAAKAIVWLILLGMGISILVAVVTGVHAL